MQMAVHMVHLSHEVSFFWLLFFFLPLVYCLNRLSRAILVVQVALFEAKEGGEGVCYLFIVDIELGYTSNDGS